MKNSYVIVFVTIVLLSLASGGCVGPEVKGQMEDIGRVSGIEIVRSVDFKCIEFNCPDFNCPGKKCTFKDKTLLKILGFRTGDRINPVTADNGRMNLEEFYWKKGFAFAEVELDSEEVPETKAAYIYKYKIKEGPRIKIKSAKFRRDTKKVKTATLKKAIKTDDKKWLFWPKYYNEEQLIEDVNSLEIAYWERGFLDPNISVELDPDILDPNMPAEEREKVTSVNITFKIDERSVYTVEKVVLAGARKIYRIDPTGEFDANDILAMLKSKEGKTYINRKAGSDVLLLRRLYHEHGFVEAEVALSRPFVPDTKSVNVVFDINEGSQFRIGHIDITGNKWTQDKVIRRVLDSYGFQPGQYYDLNIARGDGSGELEREIRQVVLAEDANITAITPPGWEKGEPNYKNVEVHIKEGKTGQWVVSGGLSSDRGVIGGLIWEQRNFDIRDWPGNLGELFSVFFSDPETGPRAFRGAGQSMRISLMPGVELSQYSINFTEPYFRDQPISLDITGLDNEWRRESYDEGRTKGSIKFGERYENRYRNRWRTSIGFRIENVGVDSIDPNAPREIKDIQGGTALVGVKLGIGKDLTDDRFNPGKGYRLNGSYEQVSGDYTFGILSGTYRGYKTIKEDLAGRRTILAIGVRGSTVLGDAPAFEKFYAGGMYSIRGFTYRGVSTRGVPDVNGVPQIGSMSVDPIGSDWIFLANAELTVPLVSEDIAALFFVDSGTIDSGSYRVSAGVGIQIFIPQWFGPVPMRIGVAAPLLKDDSDDTESFFFSVGRLF